MPECWVRKTKGGTDLFGRLEWDKPSVTIRTEFFKPEKGRYLHPEADRPITHREAARIQGFPDDFMFSGSKIRVARQIGNAVPVGLARAIAESVLDMLEGCRATQGSRKREGQTEGLLRS
jgi:DNA (cytosine-5)-methyltransferase 1